MDWRDLKLVHPIQGQGPGGEFSVRARTELSGDLLNVSFEVRGGAPSYVNPALPMDRSAWTLWDWDVVEVFVGAGESLFPYYEFQLSPLGQFLKIRIHVPRKKFDQEIDEDFGKHVTRLNDRDWDARFEIPLKPLGWTGRPETIRGGLFAILDRPEARTYWSWFLPPQQTPDFHLPEKFQRLV
jgi:hypothetical protein